MTLSIRVLQMKGQDGNSATSMWKHLDMLDFKITYITLQVALSQNWIGYSEGCSISHLELLCVNAGWCGLEIFVMYDIGGAMMMEAMVIF
jgi:hypothetical protein